MQAPSGFNFLSQWSSELKHLSKDVGTFSSDSLISIENYLPDTKVETHILDVLKQLIDRLGNGSNPEVFAQFKDIKSKLVKLLKDRTAFIDQGKTTVSDLWTVQAIKMDRIAAEPLMRASASFQDLRFMIEEVCQYRLENSKQLALQDIDKFRSMLTQHVNALPGDHKAKRKIIETLNNDLNELTVATKSLDLVKAKAIISHMEKLT